jgi:hypothetical protein
VRAWGARGERLTVLADLPVEIDPDEVLRFQGYKRGGVAPDATVLELFHEALTLGRELMAPRAVIRWARVTGQASDRLETDEVAFTIPGIGRHWGPVEAVAAAVVTIGDALERRVAELWATRELPLAAMLDSTGSGAVESLAEYVNDLLCQEGLARGWRVTNRVSPGYAAWDLREQRQLFALCPGDVIGVHLNEACVMTPEKSISLLVGAGPEARVDHYFSQCARCWMRDCAYRRVPMRGTVRRG